MRPGVYVTESVMATPVAASAPSSSAGALVSPLPSGPTTPTYVTSWYAFANLFGNLNANYEATFAANSFFKAGGRELYVTRVVKTDADYADVTLLAADATSQWITFIAKSEGTYGNLLRIRITKNTANYYDIEVIKEGGLMGDADDSILETFYDLDLATFGNQEIVNVFGLRSQYVNAFWGSNTGNSVVPTSFSVLALSTGSDGTSGASYDYASALDMLATVDRTLVIFSPRQTTSTVVSALIAFAEEHKSFVVLDTPHDYTVADTLDYVSDIGVTSYAAVYYPHLWVADTTSRSRDAIRLIGPSGAVAGMYLNTDATTGVFKAPAGLQATLPGVVALGRSLTTAELDSMNNDTSPVNAIRVVAGTGPVVMGARTLDQSKSTRYVNIRRTLLYLDRELKSRLEFALFQNNDANLWGRMRTTLDVFLDGFWGSGGLRGATKQQAYYVKIDRENNTASDIANGIVNVEVGIALQYPAEFIKIKLTQQTQL